MSVNHPRPYLSLLFICLVLLCAGCNHGTGYIFTPGPPYPMPAIVQQLLPYEDVWFCTEDHVQLHGWYIVGSPDKPLVLFFHGNATTLAHRWENILDLYQHGYSVFIFDYRGFGRSDSWPRSEQDLLRDAQAALSYVEWRGWTREKIVYYGRSMGAAVAVHLALEQPPAAIILEAPFTSLREEAMFHSPLIFSVFGWWMLPDEFNNVKRLPQLKAPLLLIHGDQDQIVPFRMSQQLFKLAPRPKVFLPVVGGGHTNAFQFAAPRFHQVWQKFIAQALSWQNNHHTAPAQAMTTHDRTMTDEQ